MQRKIQIPKKIFLVGREKLTEEKKQKVDTLLEKYPELKGFYWAKEKPSRAEATKLLENIIFNLKSADDAELINPLKTPFFRGPQICFTCYRGLLKNERSEFFRRN